MHGFSRIRAGVSRAVVIRSTHHIHGTFMMVIRVCQKAQDIETMLV